MKVIVISDLHGRPIWKTMANREKADLAIFLGDFVDSFTIPWDKQLSNLLDIVQYKKDNPDNVILLIGNHDCCYFTGGDTNISGYQPIASHHFNPVYEELYKNKLIQACYTLDNFLFIHAGFTKTWAKNNDIPVDNPMLMNDLFYQTIKPFEFQRAPATRLSAYDSTGDNVWQSPTWVRPMSLKQDAPAGWNQIVGHTNQKRVKIEKTVAGDDVYFCDTQDWSGEYIVITDGIVDIKKLEE